MTTATELTRIIAAKAAIRSAIEAKGVTVPAIDTLEDYAAHIAAITGGGATAPAALSIGQWTLTPGPGLLAFDITELPSDGGVAISAIQYTLDAGSTWVAFAGTGTGTRIVTAGVSNGVESSAQVRAVNAVGAGPASDVKSATPVAPSGAAAWVAVTSISSAQISGVGQTPAKPAGTVASDLLVLVLTDITLVSRQGITVPAGWSLATEIYTDFADLGHAIFTAAGDVASTTFASSVGANVSFDLHRISGANLAAPVRASAVKTTVEADPNYSDVSVSDYPSPAVTASAGDLVFAHYSQPQSDTAVGTPTAGYTRRVNGVVPNTRSTLTQANISAGSTGAISHNGSAAWQSRTSSTLAIASA